MNDPVLAERLRSEQQLASLVELDNMDLRTAIGRILDDEQLRRIITLGLIDYDEDEIRKWHRLILGAAAAVPDVPPEALDSDRYLAAAVALVARGLKAPDE
jgi:hypothetical protein